MVLVMGLAGLLVAAFPVPGEPIDLSQTTIVMRGEGASTVESTIAQMLVEEVQARTGLTWTRSTQWPTEGAVVALALGNAEALQGVNLPSLEVSPEPEGYVLYSDVIAPARPVVWIIGADDRGLLFGVGRLLRLLDWGPGKASVVAPLHIATAPEYPLRGHQLGYRARANSYDAWDARQYEQYIRELAFFGTNAIENIPFEDSDPSPHMKVPRDAMNLEIGRICARYGLEHWIWSPATFDLNDTVKRAELLDQHKAFFEACERLDAVFFPGGDPGDNHPRLVMPFLEELAALLAKAHPDARIWLSLQGFEPENVAFTFRWIEKHQPAWLAGLVCGPGSPPIPLTRAKLPREYKLRHYPDITHTVRSQYPTQWWDPAYAFTLGREPVNPEPLRYAEVHNLFAPYTDGFLTYSDGAHDDVNKVIWSACGWDTKTAARETLIEYGRVFFGPDAAGAAADGILALERNWHGPLESNGGVAATLALWQGLEASHPELAGNWRWQSLLLRGYYDAYTRARLIYESALEREATAALARAGEVGPETAMKDALAVLQRAETVPVQAEWRARVVALCDALFHSIGLQTSVEKYQASGAERGAVLDFLDIPLNNRWWYEDEFVKVRALPDEVARLARIDIIHAWEDPGTGGYYDDIGNVAKSPHVVRGEGTNTDPNYDRNPAPDCMWWDNGRTRARHSWVTYMDWPLGLRYEGVEPGADYVVRTTGNRDCLLRVNGQRVTPSIDGKGMGELKEFPVPRKLYEGGLIELSFDLPLEPGVNWREASRLTEVWLIRK